MGGIADGIAAWLDRTRWPTLPGTSQASWEEPRVSTLASPFRTKRLKALGNAIVPQQIYPLLAWIVAYERSVAMEGEEEQQQQEKQQQEAEETG